MGAITLSETQAKWLGKLSNGAAPLPIQPFSKLRDLGLVEKAEGSAGQRGYTMAQLTAAGRAQLTS